MQKTQEELKERYSALPEVLKESMGSDASADVIKTVAEQNGLSPKSKQALVHVIGYTMLGFIKMRDFVDELEKEAQIDHETAVKIAKVIHKQLFMPVRDAMLEAYGGTFEMNMQGKVPVPTGNPAPVKKDPVAEVSQAEPQAMVPPPQPAPVAPTPPPTPVQEKPFADVPDPELPQLEKKAAEPIKFMPGNLPGAEEITPEETNLNRDEVLHGIEEPEVEQGVVEEQPVLIKKIPETPGPHAGGANFMEERLNAPTATKLEPQKSVEPKPNIPRPPEHMDYGSGDPYREPIN